MLCRSGSYKRNNDGKGANGLVPGSANPAWLVGGNWLDLGVGGRFFTRYGLGQHEFVGFGNT